MKVYVIKRNDGKYLSKNYNYNYNLKNPSQTSWTENILNARTYKDKYDADNFCNTIDCQIIECNLMETTELSNYIKQVRKEVCEEIREYLEKNKGTLLGGYNHQTLKYDEIDVCNVKLLNEFLDQIQGEGE